MKWGTTDVSIPISHKHAIASREAGTAPARRRRWPTGSVNLESISGASSPVFSSSTAAMRRQGMAEAVQLKSLRENRKSASRRSRRRKERISIKEMMGMLDTDNEGQRKRGEKERSQKKKKTRNGAKESPSRGVHGGRIKRRSRRRKERISIRSMMGLQEEAGQSEKSTRPENTPKQPFSPKVTKKKTLGRSRSSSNLDLHELARKEQRQKEMGQSSAATRATRPMTAKGSSRRKEIEDILGPMATADISKVSSFLIRGTELQRCVERRLHR